MVSKQINKDKRYKNAFNNKMVKQWTKISITNIYIYINRSNIGKGRVGVLWSGFRGGSFL